MLIRKVIFPEKFIYMILHILSDLHIEFAPFKISKTNADVIILAGDIHLGEKGFE